MGTAYRSAKLACELALERLERNPSHPLARLCYESAVEALERVEALELSQNDARLGANPPSVA
jgi:hypothetical protein